MTGNEEYENDSRLQLQQHEMMIVMLLLVVLVADGDILAMLKQSATEGYFAIKGRNSLPSPQ